MAVIDKNDILIRRYGAEDADCWNAFVEKSKNGTFLHDRRYMDYHSDRFSDFSLMMYDKRQRLVAVLPANIKHNAVVSHQGLTYGGLLTDAKATASTVISCFEALKDYLRQNGIDIFRYKPTPYIYHKLPADEDLYALSATMKAHLVQRNLSSAIDLTAPLRFTESRRSGIRKALREGLTIAESNDYDTFWQILSHNLKSKHGVSPVHSVEEIKLLHSRFPEQIRLFATMKGDKMQGGTVLYITPTVVHSQYISASEEGKQVGAIDLLFDHLINSGVFAEHKYFDFGISNDPQTGGINNELLFQKEHFGGRAVCYDTYEVGL